MGTTELRKEAHRFIDRANDKDLKKVLALAKSHEEDEEDYSLGFIPHKYANDPFMEKDPRDIHYRVIWS